MTGRLLIEKNTKALMALHEGLKHPGPEDQDRSIAISQYFQRYDQLAFPRLFDRRKTRPEDSPTFHVKY